MGVEIVFVGTLYLQCKEGKCTDKKCVAADLVKEVKQVGQNSWKIVGRNIDHNDVEKDHEHFQNLKAIFNALSPTHTFHGSILVCYPEYDSVSLITIVEDGAQERLCKRKAKWVEEETDSG